MQVSYTPFRFTFQIFIAASDPFNIVHLNFPRTRATKSYSRSLYVYSSQGTSRQGTNTFRDSTIPTTFIKFQTDNSTLWLFLIACLDSSSANAGLTHSSKNASTCCGARPIKLRGSRSRSSWPLIGSKYFSFLIRSMRSFSSPSCLTWYPASCERTFVVVDQQKRATQVNWRHTLIFSWASCLSPPFLTIAMIRFSVAMKGSSWETWRAITWG